LRQQGELVLEEKPLFVVPHHGRSHPFSLCLIKLDEHSTVTSSPSVLISRLLRKASPIDRELFLNLSYVNFPKSLEPEDHPDQVALAIFQTNAVAAGNGVGIFPRMARLNHGCSSAFNVVYTWQEQEGVLVVHALRDIQKGNVRCSLSEFFVLIFLLRSY
jgi:hypothetical protein